MIEDGGLLLWGVVLELGVWHNTPVFILRRCYGGGMLGLGDLRLGDILWGQGIVGLVGTRDCEKIGEDCRIVRLRGCRVVGLVRMKD